LEISPGIGYSLFTEEAMELKYTYTMDGGFFVGHLDDYPEYTTLCEDFEDFENNLLDVYEMIQDGTLEVKEHKGVLTVKEAAG
jgi:hypothetical protein